MSSLVDGAGDPPPFVSSRHAAYIVAVSKKTESIEFVLTEYMRMSGVYWGVTALALLDEDLRHVMDGAEVVEWIVRCQHSDGGFGGSEAHDAHMLYTLSALQVLALYDALDRVRLSHAVRMLTGSIKQVDGEAAAKFVASLQQPDGSFCGDKWGEVDTRFSYCAMASLSILGKLDLVDVDGAARFVAQCRNFDGGYGATPGAESHAGQIFCCVGALCIAGRLEAVDRELLGWWLAERQCDSGGLNGRPEKQADVCYSWWILSSLAMLGCQHWIDEDALASFILRCQDVDDGGIADRPGNMSDVFHTFFGIGGLSLLGWLGRNVADHEPMSDIDPVYALPKGLVAKLGLKATTFPVATKSLLEVTQAKMAL